MRNSLTTAIIFLSLTSGMLVATPAKAEQRLGGMNLDRACDDMARGFYGDKYISSKAWAENPKDAYTWRCAMSFLNPNTGVVTTRIGFNVHHVCHLQYNNKRAYARADNEKDAYSWSCYLP
jgi:hypothetical protein